MKIQGKSISSRRVNEEAMRQFSLMQGQKAAQCGWGLANMGSRERRQSWRAGKTTEHLSSHVKELDCLLGYWEAHQRVLCKGIVTSLTL